MDAIKIGKKEYVVLAKKEYEQLVTMAARKTAPAKKHSIPDAKKLAYKLIDNWSKEK